MKRSALIALTAVALAGCVTYNTRGDGITRLRVGETGTVGGPKVTPVKLLEDSRCPAGTQCVWAGRVRLTVKIVTGAGTEQRDMTMGEAQQVADGQLTLVETWPQKKANDTLYPDEYGFGFTFAGGL